MEDELKSKLLTSDLYQFFRDEVLRLGMEGFFKEYNVLEMYHFIENNRRHEGYKLFVCLAEKDFNSFVHFIKDKKEILTLFLKQNDSFYSLFAGANLESFKILFHELRTNPNLTNCNYSFLTVISYEVIKKYLEGDIPLDDVAFLVNYNHGVRADFFLHDERALPLLCEGKLSVSLLLNSDLKVSHEILESDVLFDGIKSVNIITFRNNFNKIIKANPSIVFLEKMKNYEKNLIENFDTEEEEFAPLKGMDEKTYASLYESKKDRFLYGYEPTAFFRNKKAWSLKKLKDLVIDYLFCDNVYNVIKNIKEMMRYQKRIEKTLISPFMMELYENVLHTQEKNSKEIMDLYFQHKDSNINTRFYEDIRMLRENSYKEMIKKLYVPKNRNEALFERHGVDIHILNGEDFTMLIRGLNMGFRNSTRLYRECFSLIDQDNLARVSAEFYYGFTNVDYNKILHVFETDSYSSDCANSTKRVNRIMTSEEINSYNGLSEIQIITGEGYPMQPDYLVVFDALSEAKIEYAKKLQLPIVFIDSNKYANKKELIKKDLYEKENYVQDEYDERKELGRY